MFHRSDPTFSKIAFFLILFSSFFVQEIRTKYKNVLFSRVTHKERCLCLNLVNSLKFLKRNTRTYSKIICGHLFKSNLLHCERTSIFPPTEFHRNFYFWRLKLQLTEFVLKVGCDIERQKSPTFS